MQQGPRVVVIGLDCGTPKLLFDDLAGEDSALFVYQGPNGRIVICQMFQGDQADLPPAGDIREQNGIEFHVYQEAGRTLVFWQEGEVLCVLTSDIPVEDLVALAYAKAMKPA